MKGTISGTVLLLVLFGVTWTWAYPKIDIDNFPMRRMYVDVEDIDQNGIGSRIVNGREVVPNSIPYQVWLLFRSGPTSTSGWTCGGSVITTKFVLTAAHCVVGAGIVDVYLGSHDLSRDEPNAIIVRSSVMRRHENYNSNTITNDVGLIELPEPLVLNQYIDVVQLPSRAQLQNLFEAENVRVSGWGLTTGGGSRSQVLLAVNSTVLPNAECRSHFNIFQNSEVCISGAGGVGACNGDSGGPLIAGNTQIGIVSYGRTGCLLGSPSVFARVTSFLDWIEQYTDYVVL